MPARGAKPSAMNTPLLARLRQLAEETSQAEVARSIGIKPISLWRIFQGERMPSFATLVALYRAHPKRFPELRLLVDEKARGR